MLGVSSAGLEARYLFSGKGAVSCQPGATPGQRPGATPWATPQYPSSVPLASCRHNETMRDANNTPNQSVAADVSRLKLDPRPARNGRLRNRSDPAHAGCYKREWKSTGATGRGAIAGSTIGVAFKSMLNRYSSRGERPTTRPSRSDG